MAERETRSEPRPDYSGQHRTHARPPRPRHTHRRGGLNWLVTILTAIIAAAAIVCGCIVFFKVEYVVADDSLTYTGQQIVDASGITVGNNLYLMNKYELEEKLVQTLPYLKTARIYRELPGTIHIDVTETTAVAAIQVSNGYWLIDETGKLLEMAADPGDLLPVKGINLTNPSAGVEFDTDATYRAKKIGLIALIEQLVNQEAMANIQLVDMTDAGTIVITYTDKYTVKMPYSTDFTRKILAMVRIAEELAEENDERSGVIDITQDNGWHFIPD